jgi:hypothetical protein
MLGDVFGGFILLDTVKAPAADGDNKPRDERRSVKDFGNSVGCPVDFVTIAVIRDKIAAVLHSSAGSGASESAVKREER